MSSIHNKSSRCDSPQSPPPQHLSSLSPQHKQRSHNSSSSSSKSSTSSSSSPQHGQYQHDRHRYHHHQSTTTTNNNSKSHATNKDNSTTKSSSHRKPHHHHHHHHGHSRSRSHSPWRNAEPSSSLLLLSTNRRHNTSFVDRRHRFTNTNGGGGFVMRGGLASRRYTTTSTNTTTTNNNNNNNNTSTTRAISTSPLHKKSAPVNELDVNCIEMMIKKEKTIDNTNGTTNVTTTTATSSFRAPPSGGIYRGGKMLNYSIGGRRYDRAIGGFYRQGREFIANRTPNMMMMQRRYLMMGVRDTSDGRHSLRSNKRDVMEYDQRDEHKQIKEDDNNKPIMNLFDPCKVPTGRSYFTHDDRTTKPIRSRGGRFSDNNERNQRRYDNAPIGWRNTAQVRNYGRDRNVNNQQQSSSSYRKRIDEEVKGSDGIWKHDLFEEDDQEEEEMNV